MPYHHRSASLTLHAGCAEYAVIIVNKLLNHTPHPSTAWHCTLCKLASARFVQTLKHSSPGISRTCRKKFQGFHDSKNAFSTTLQIHYVDSMVT